MRADVMWPFEVLLPFLDANLTGEAHVVFVLAGSAGGSLGDLIANIAARPKGRDVMSRIPEGNHLSVDPLAVGDQVAVALSQLVGSGAASGRPVGLVEKAALYYMAVTPYLRNAPASVSSLPAPSIGCPSAKVASSMTISSGPATRRTRGVLGDDERNHLGFGAGLRRGDRMSSGAWYVAHGYSDVRPGRAHVVGVVPTATAPVCAISRARAPVWSSWTRAGRKMSALALTQERERRAAIVTGIAEEDVTDVPAEAVVAAASEYDVHPATTVKGVVAAAAAHDVVARSSVDHIDPAATHDHVGTVGACEYVVTVGADDRRPDAVARHSGPRRLRERNALRLEGKGAGDGASQRRRDRRLRCGSTEQGICGGEDAIRTELHPGGCDVDPVDGERPIPASDTRTRTISPSSVPKYCGPHRMFWLVRWLPRP